MRALLPPETALELRVLRGHHAAAHIALRAARLIPRGCSNRPFSRSSSPTSRSSSGSPIAPAQRHQRRLLRRQPREPLARRRLRDDRHDALGRHVRERPGAVGRDGFAYYQIILGHLAGYLVIAFVCCRSTTATA
jgi:hypothetical protein